MTLNIFGTLPSPLTFLYKKSHVWLKRISLGSTARGGVAAESFISRLYTTYAENSKRFITIKKTAQQVFIEAHNRIQSIRMVKKRHTFAKSGTTGLVRLEVCYQTCAFISFLSRPLQSHFCKPKCRSRFPCQLGKPSTPFASCASHVLPKDRDISRNCSVSRYFDRNRYILEFHLNAAFCIENLNTAQ